MAVSLNTTLRNSRADAITTFAGNGAKLRIYTAGAGELAECVCGTPFAGAASGGVSYNSRRQRIMTLILADRVKETTTSTGTTAITLAGAATGYQSFSAAVGNGNTTYYTIADQTGANWEVGIGTYASSGNTLARTTVLASSNAGSLVTFTSGTKDVFVTLPAERAIPATTLQVLNHSSSVIQVALANGYLPVLNHSGSTINVSVS